MVGKKKKIIIPIVIILVLVLIFAYYLASSIQPKPSDTGFWVTIKGEISHSNKLKPEDLGSRPQAINVREPFHNPNLLCRSRRKGIAPINWINDNLGTYSIPIWLPAPMDVVLTTDCSGCNHNTISISDDDIEVQSNIQWDKEKCSAEEYNFPNEKEQILKNIRTSLDRIDEEMSKRNFNDTERDIIKDDIKQARRQITSSSNQNNETESLWLTYYANYFAWRAEWTLNLFDLKYCVEKTARLTRTYDDACYEPNYEADLVYQDSSDWYYSTSYGKFDDEEPYWRDPQDVNWEFDDIYRSSKELDEVFARCENSFEILNDTFEYQKPYCEKRKISIIALKWAEILILITLGVLVGLSWRDGIKNENDK